MSVGYATVIDDISLIVREFEGMSTDFCTLTSTITSVSTLCRAAIGEQIGEKAFKDKCRTIVAGYSGVARDSCKIGVSLIVMEADQVYHVRDRYYQEAMKLANIERDSLRGCFTWDAISGLVTGWLNDWASAMYIWLDIRERICFLASSVATLDAFDSMSAPQADEESDWTDDCDAEEEEETLGKRWGVAVQIHRTSSASIGQSQRYQRLKTIGTLLLMWIPQAL